MKVITLLTDFGLNDGYTGVLKGVIWNIAPDAQIADLTHSITPQSVFEGALTLTRCVRFFPPGTVHVAVVDPGVGTNRRSVAAQIGAHYFVGPDNGLFSLLIKPARSAGEAVHFYNLDQPRFWLPEISNVFHGRDIFAPVGAYLANGTAIEEVGSIISDPVMIEIPRPRKTGQGWEGEVIHVDSFGNLAINLTVEQIAPLDQVEIIVAGVHISGIVKSFGDRPIGEPAAMIDSSGWLSIAIVNGNAANSWKAGSGTKINVNKTS